MKCRHNRLAILALLPLWVLIWAQPASAGTWQVDRGRSKLGFVASYDEIPIEAQFGDYSAEILFDPAALQASMFKISVVIDTVNSNSEDRDEGMLDAEWFDSSRYPKANFSSTEFRKLNDAGTFEVTGDLSIKAATRQVTLPFSWSQTGNSARLRGQALVKRVDFNIGTGDWETDDTIGFEVEIIFDLNMSESQ